ncbi:hypothetical protein ACFFX1_19605 [Dactylosporangium sucinum]|uniref:Uncharacterized protein n=1 Tax=Dactylosporangium sucinum TaxID=1424081 RepID=A0A917U4R7_9ACTN|nr:hypothetical protein [Dactylosporangium sucinum]GGM55160.1 hypothetical protein GCM10007977_066060 [Dactylosporangium sucinum]
MIDLDLPPASPPRRSRLPRLAAVRLPLAGVVVIALAGAAAGVLAGWRLEVAREAAREAGEVALFAGVVALRAGKYTSGRVAVDGQIMIANGGQRPVEVAGLPDAGLTVRSRDRIDPGATAAFGVSTLVPCEDAFASVMPLDVSVGTWDSRWRKVTLALPSTGAQWHSDLVITCKGAA